MTLAKTYAFDTETKRIQPGRLCPPMICLTYNDGESGGILDRQDGILWLKELLQSRAVQIVGHNVAYDFGVVVHSAQDPLLHALIWAAYDHDRIGDTGIREMLRKISRGWHEFDPRTGRPPAYALAALVDEYLEEKVEGKDGDDAWRFRYGELEHVPLADWPQAAKDYAFEDARYTARVWLKQTATAIADQAPQYRAAWALHLLSAWGLRTDAEAVDALEIALHAHVDDKMRELAERGLYRWEGTKKEPRRKLTKDTAEIQRRVEAAYRAKADGAEGGGPYAPLTDGGAKAQGAGEPFSYKWISTAAEVLEDSGDVDLALLAEIAGDQKLLSTYIPILRGGTQLPINPRYSVLMATGRTSSSGPNIQNQPRKGGVRECYIPRPGHIFAGCDYHIAELCGLAQVLVDKYGVDGSNMAQAILAGRELHLETAAGLLGCSYEDAVARYKAGDPEAKEARQLSKALNFGLPGGLGADSFAAFAKAGYGVILTADRAKELKQQWLERYPEMKRYFRDIGDRVSREGGSFDQEQHRSGRIRGGVGYTDGCNGLFQGLVADGAKAALYAVLKECYLGVDYNVDLDVLLGAGWDGTADDLEHRGRAPSALYGCRPIAFIHDEIILEVPEHLPAARLAAARMSEVMVAEMARFCPDIPIHADAHLMIRWEKSAEPVFDENGELIPWLPKPKAK